MNIIPSFVCNFHCPFCSVRKNTGKLLDLEWLENFLNNIDDITYLEILGGEPLILPYEYLKRLIKICHNKLGKKPKMYTNFSINNPLIKLTDPVISYDPGTREAQTTVLNNILTLDIPFHMSCILTKPFVKNGADYYIKLANHLGKNLQHIDLCRYVRFNNYPDYTVNCDELIKFLIELIAKDTKHKFRLSSYYAFDDIESEKRSFYDCLEILPDKSFEIATRNHINSQRFYDFEEAKKYYAFINEKTLLKQCENCEFKYNCIQQYSNASECKDRRIMEVLKQIYEHSSKLSL